MKVYSPGDIADLLRIKPSTLRKYSLLLEEVGYTFQKNDKGQRWYSDEDVIAFKKIIAFKNDGAMSLKQSVEAVYMWAKEKDVTLPSTDTEPNTERYNLIAAVKEQGKQIEELKELLINQNTYINERLEERDRALMQSLREVQEIKQLAATKEPWWSRWWKFWG